MNRVMDGAVVMDVEYLDQERGTESLGLFAARRIEAAKVILHYYRESKCHQAYRCRRDAAIAIQAGVRGCQARCKAAVLSQVHPVISCRIAPDQSNLDKCSPGVVSVNSSPIPPPPVENNSINRRNPIHIHDLCMLFDETVTFLPMVEAHVNEINVFATRMISYEREQAVIYIQRSLRAFSATSAAIAETLELSGQDSSPSFLIAPPYSSPTPAGWDGLSMDLSDLHTEISRRGSIRDLVKDSADAKPIGSVLRRISKLSTSAKTGIANLKIFDADEKISVLNIMGTICIIIRQCDRSEGHIDLVELGTSIIRDICVDGNHVDDVLLVEDCVSVLVTCVQFYRDHERIIEAALEALLALSCHRYGEALLATHASYLPRLRAVNNIMQLQLQRHSTCNDRMRKVDVILKAIENRRQNRASEFFSEELAKVSRAVPCIAPKMRCSAELLEHLLGRFPSF